MSHNLELLSFQKMYGLLEFIRKMKVLQRSARRRSWRVADTLNCQIFFFFQPIGNYSSVSVCFVFLLIIFLLFYVLLLNTGVKRVRLKCDCNTITFLQRVLKFAYYTVNAGGFVISLAGSFLWWHLPLRRHDMFINL